VKRLVSINGIPKGTIVISNSRKKLFFGVSRGKAIQYDIAIGAQGRSWTGKRHITRRVKKPSWRATSDILKDNPNLTEVIPGGSPRNPMGAAALLISGAGQYAIHGTNKPGSIGRSVSYGCIRMHNSDVLDLFKRVRYGTPVVVRN